MNKEKRAVIIFLNKSPAIIVKLRDYNTLFGQNNSDIIINDPNLSAPHFQIQKVEENYKIFDMNSFKGTFINGFRVDRNQVLVENDLIEAGDSKFEFALMNIEDVDHIPSIGKIYL